MTFHGECGQNFGKLIRWNKSGEFLNSINSLFK